MIGCDIFLSKYQNDVVSSKVKYAGPENEG
jgi:hypothetical protein